MLLTSWVRTFCQSLQTRRRGGRRGFRRTTPALHGHSRRGLLVERLEDRSLMTALVIDQQFVNASPGPISIGNTTIDLDNDGTPEFDSIIIDTVAMPGPGGAAISINLTGLTLDQIAFKQVSLTDPATTGIDVTLNNVLLNNLTFENVTTVGTGAGSIDISLIDVRLPELTVVDSNINSGGGAGLNITLASNIRDSRIDELDISRNVIDGVRIASTGQVRSVTSATAGSPGRLIVVDHGLSDGAVVEVTGVTGVSGLNTRAAVRVIDENTIELVGTTAAGTYSGGGTLTLFSAVESLRITRNSITGTSGSDGLSVDLSLTRAPGLTISNNPAIRSIELALDHSPIDGLTIRDNTSIVADRPQVDAVHVELTSSTLTNLIISGNNIQGNGVAGGEGVVFEALDSNVYGSFTGNLIDNTLGNGLSFSGSSTAAFRDSNRGALVFDFASFSAETTLTGAVSAADTLLTVVDARAFQPQQVILVDNEQMQITAISGNTLTVVRGERGTLPLVHAAGASLRSVTSSVSGTRRNLSGNTFSRNDGAGLFVDLPVDSILIAEIQGNTFSQNQNRGIDITVEDSRAVETQVRRGGISRTSSTLRVVDASVFSDFLFPFNIQVDGEQMTVTGIDGNDLSVVRAINGTRAAFHSSNTTVVATSGDALRLDVGGDSASEANVFTQNTRESIRLTLEDTVAGAFTIQGNTITGGIDPDDVNGPLTADAIAVFLVGTNVDNEATNVLRRSVISDNLLGVAGVASIPNSIQAATTVFTVTDGSVFAVNQLVQIEGEVIRITQISSNTVTAARAQNGTAAAAHAAGTVLIPQAGGNQGRGVNIFFDENSAVEDLQITGNTIANNLDDGVRLRREDDAVTRTVNPVDGQARAVTISDNIIVRNALNPAPEQLNAAGVQPFGAGVEIVGLNGSFDSTDVEIRNNQIMAHGDGFGGLANGINLRTEADAQLLVDIIGNRILFNESNGINMTSRENSSTDKRDIGGLFAKNEILENGDNGILVDGRFGIFNLLEIGREGVDPADGVALGNTIQFNDRNGIDIRRGGRATIVANAIDFNGSEPLFTAIGAATPGTGIVGSGIHVANGTPNGVASTNLDPLVRLAIKGNNLEGNRGMGIDINSRLGSRVDVTIRDNLVTQNQNDGIELSGPVQATLLGNFVDRNTGRGIDLMNFGLGGLGLVQSNYRIGDGQESGRNVVAGNRQEGVYYVTTANVQDQNLLGSNQASRLATGDTSSRPAAILQIDTNTVSDNGVSSGLTGTGIVFWIGSSGSETLGADSNLPYNTRMGSGTGIGTVGGLEDVTERAINGTGGNTFSSGTTTPINSRTNARVINNDFEGNFGDDFRVQAFVSTVNPTTSATFWDIRSTPTYRLDTYESDPLSRLNLVYEGNEGNGLDSRNFVEGSGYTNNEELFKSRVTNTTIAQPPGPFASGTRARDITRVPSRTAPTGTLQPIQGSPPNGAPDAIYPITGIQPVDVGNGITELQLTLGADLFGAYGGLFPFSEGATVHVTNVSGINGELHAANGSYQAVLIDPVARTLILQNTAGEGGPQWLTGGFVVVNTERSTPNINPPFQYSGMGPTTFRVAAGADTSGITPQNEFRSGDNFNAGPDGDGPNGLSDWGLWTPNARRSGVITSVQNLGGGVIQVTSQNHGLSDRRRIEISGVNGVPAANGIFRIEVTGPDTFTFNGIFDGSYIDGGEFKTRDDSFPDPIAPTFPVSTVVSLTPDPRTTSSGVVTLNFTEPVTSIDVDDLFLSLDGVPVDISNLSVEQVSPTQYTIDLTSVTQIEGQYELRIDNGLPEASIVPVSPDPRTSPAPVVTVNFNEDVSGVDALDFVLSRDVGDSRGFVPVDLSELGANVVVTQLSPSQYTLNLASVTDVVGSYRLTLLAPRTTTLNAVQSSGIGSIITIHSQDHGLSNGQTVTLSGVRGNNLGSSTAINSTYRIITTDKDHFQLFDDTLSVALTADDTGYAGGTWRFDPGIVDRVGKPFSVDRFNVIADTTEVWVRTNTSPTVDIVDVTPDPRNIPVPTIEVRFSEPVRAAQFTFTDLRLVRNVGFGAVAVTLTAANNPVPLDLDTDGYATRFTVPNLSALTGTAAAGGTPAQYRLTVITTDSSRITDRQGSFLAFQATEDWTFVLTGPAPDILDVFPDPRAVPVGVVTFTFNEPVTGIANGSNAEQYFTLTRTLNTGVVESVPLRDANGTPLTITRNSSTSFEIDLTGVTGGTAGESVDGTYELRLRRGTGIVAAGDSESLAVDAVDTWIQDSVVPTADVFDVDPDPRIQHAGLVTIDFSEPVTGVDRLNADTDFSLTLDIGDGNGPQPVSLAGLRVRPANPVDSTGTAVGPFNLATTVFASRYVIDLSRLTTVDGVYALSMKDTGGITDATGNSFVATAESADSWVLIPKLDTDRIIDDVFPGRPIPVFVNRALELPNPVVNDAVEQWFLDNTAPTVVLATSDVTPDPRSTSVGVVTIEFTEPVAGVNLSDFVLTRDGSNVSLSELPLVQLTSSLYTLDLNLVTGAPGAYSFGIQGAGSLIQDLAGNPLSATLITLDSWVVENIGPSALLSVTPEQRTTPANDIHVTFTKEVGVTGVSLSDFRLERDTGSGFVPVLITSGTITPDSPAGGFDDSFTLDLSAAGLTDIEGRYRITIVAADSGIIDAAGIELGADTSTEWVLDNTAPQADVVDVLPDPRLTDAGIVNILFSEPVTGVNTDDLQLLRNGTPVSLAGLSVRQETGRRYTIDLTTVTAADGSYELRLLTTDAVTPIRDLAGNLLPVEPSLGVAGAAARDQWFKGVDVVAPTVDIVDVPTPRNTPAGVVTINFSEDVTGVSIADFRLTKNGSPVTLSASMLTAAPGSTSQYLLDLTNVSLEQGDYVLSVLTTDAVTPIRDTANNPLAGVAGIANSNAWRNSLIDPFAIITPVTPDPRLRPTGVITVTFSQPVQGVDITDFSLTRDAGNGALPVSLRGIEATPSPAGPTVWFIDLTSVTGTAGTYRLTLTAAGSGIQEAGTGNPFLSDAVESWETLTTINVNSTLDTVDATPGDGRVADSAGRVTLRAAIMEANALAGDDVIVLGAGTWSLGIAGAGEQLGRTGDFDILDTTGTLTIRGAGAGSTFIDGAALERIFHVSSGATLILDGVTVRNGRVTGSEDGGAIRNDGGTVTVSNSILSGNVSLDDGGAVNNSGTMTIVNSTLSKNSAVNGGGAIRNVGTLTIINSTVGGTFDPTVTPVVDNRNVAGLNGGGLLNLAGGTATIINSTFSGNLANAGAGGGIRNQGTASLRNVTVTANYSSQAGGGVSAASGSLTTRNSLFAGNTSVATNGVDVSVAAAAALTSAGNNLVRNTTGTLGQFTAGAGDVLNQNPLLGALTTNGGPTLTHAILLGSPAIDAGQATADETDQRGAPRLLGNGRVDIGAYEFGGLYVDVSTAGVDSIDVTPGDGIVADSLGRKTLRAAVMEANALATSGASVSNAILLGTASYDLSLVEIDRTAPTADVVDVVPDPLRAFSATTPVDPVDRITINFSEPVTGVSLAGFSLTRDTGTGGPAGVALTGVTLTVVSPSQYVLDGLRPLLAADGLYRLTLNPAGVTDLAIARNPLAGQTGLPAGSPVVESFVRGQDRFVPTATLTQVTSPRTTNPGVLTLDFSESVTGISLASGAPNFALTYDSDGAGPVAAVNVSLSSVAVQQQSQSRYVLDLSGVQGQNRLTTVGTYSLTFSAGTVQDLANPANAFTGSLNTAWQVQVDTFAPTADIVDVSGDPRIGAPGTITVNFNEDVQGIDLTNAEVDFDLFFDVDGFAGGVASEQISLTGRTVTRINDRQYTLNLSTVATADGVYRLSLKTDSGNIRDRATTPNLLVAAPGLGAGQAAIDEFLIGDDLVVTDTVTPVSFGFRADAFGDLDVLAGTLTIIGTGASGSLIDARQIDRVFDVHAGATFNVDSTTIRGGRLLNAKDGAGIRNNSTVTLTDAIVSGNTAATGNGGGVFNNGSLTVTRSSLSSNSADYGGGVYNDAGSVTIIEGSFTSNSAATDGGGLYNNRSAAVTMRGSTVTGNSAGRDGGGIHNNDSGTLIVQDSTLASNVAVDEGGAVFNELAAVTTITNSTLAFNRADSGAGIFNEDGVVTLSLSALSANEASTDGGALYVTSAGVVNASNVTVSGNQAGNNGGGLWSDGTVSLSDARILDNAASGSGGGIRNTRSLTVQASEISGNAAGAGGGGIDSSSAGSVSLTSTEIAANTAGLNGGGINNSGMSTVSLVLSTIEGNSAVGMGGGLSQTSLGTVSVLNSTVALNTAASGGGLHTTRALTFQNSTLSSNTATGSGGGLRNSGGTVSFQSATIFNNEAGTTGGGIQNDSSFGAASLKNTIVARNMATTGPDISGIQFVSQGNNLIGDRGTVTTFVNGTGGNVVGTAGNEIDPLLGPLQDNGGSNRTHALLFGSPARDAGTNVGVLSTDQRGFARIFDGDGNGLATVDIGSFESGFVINTFRDTVDVLPGDRSSADFEGNSSLRAAVMESNALAGDDTILLLPGTYQLTIAGREEDGGAQGDLDVTDSLTIIGAGPDQTVIDAASLDRVFHVLPGGRLSLQNLTIVGGNEVRGGGLLNQGTVSMKNVVIRDNMADFGAGILNDRITSALAGAITAGASSLTLTSLGSLPTTAGYDIRIGTEELRVTSVSGNTLTVQRQVNGTTAAAHAAASSVTLVQQMTLLDSTITGNAARLKGGGIFNRNDLTLTRMTLSGNHSNAQGGGLYNESVVVIDATTFDGNSAGASGGGLYNEGLGGGLTSRATVTGSTFFDNVAGVKGGGIYNNDIVDVLNSTFSGNSAGSLGGAILNTPHIETAGVTGTMTITNATVTDNTTDNRGAGIANVTGARVDIRNSIVAANIARNSDDDVTGDFNSQGTNFIGDVGSATGLLNGVNGDQVGTAASPFDPVLESLADNGGPTRTHSLVNGSPAIDAGDNSGGDPVDQRTGRRPTDTSADIGAFEVQENRLSINDVTMTEGGTGSTLFVFSVVLETATAEPISVAYTTVQDTAKENSDFLPVSGVLNFEAGDVSRTVVVEVNGDPTPEQIEQFFLRLSNPVNAVVTRSQAVGTIQNDDAKVESVDVQVTEGDAGTQTLTFTVTLSAALQESATIDFTTADDTAVAGSDYDLIAGTLTYAPGETSKTVVVSVHGDTASEANETFVLNLSNAVDATGDPLTMPDAQFVGTILNDEVSLSLTGVTAVEGTGGTRNFGFTVTLANPVSTPVTVQVSTADGTATGGTDFLTQTGTLVTIPAGTTTVTHNVVVVSDSEFESGTGTFESFTLQLVTGSATRGGATLPGATLGSAATGSIEDDEPRPVQWLITLNAAGTTLQVFRTDDTVTGMLVDSTMDLTTPFVVNGENTLDDLFIVDYTNGAPIPTGGLTVNGLGQTAGDSLEIRNGTVSDVVYTATAAHDGTVAITSLAAATRVVTYTGLEPVLDNLTAQNRTFTIDAVHTGNHPIRVARAGTRTVIDSSGTAAFEKVTFANPTSTLTVNAGDGNNTITLEALDAAFAAGFTLNAQGGNDTVVATGFNLGLVANLGTGNDTLTGSNQADTINGEAGTDSISGGGGNDRLRGHGGATADDSLADILNGDAGGDTLEGDGGADVLNGGADNDSMLGGTGNDVISGGTGDDTVNGESGADSVLGGDGLDNLFGGTGNDTIDGQAGNDLVDGGSDNDVVRGGADNDTVRGGADNDNLSGDDGVDSVLGEDGDDTLAGGQGTDVLNGGNGVDRVAETATGSQSIILTNTAVIVGGLSDSHTLIENFSLTGGDLANVIDASAYTGGAVTISGGDGNDTLTGSPGNDSIVGATGSDSIVAGAGSDTVLAGDGNDIVDAGDGADSVSGGDGRDTLTGGAGNDTLLGEGGNDSVLGGADDDSILGGGGSDFLDGQAGNDYARGGSPVSDGDTADTIRGGEGNDILLGDAGADDMDGQAGDDNLLGGADIDLLSAGLGNDTVDGQGATGDMVTLTGSALADQFTISPFVNKYFTITVSGGVTYSVRLRQTERIVLNTLAGGDTVRINNLATVVGTFEPDGANIEVDLGAGNDSLDAVANASQLFATTVLGGEGNDTLSGGAGNDSLDGGVGDDMLRDTNAIVRSDRTPGNRLIGGDGNDGITGSLADDFISGGIGNDTIAGGAGHDLIDAGDGNDNIRGNGGFDTIMGGDGNDTLSGDQSADTIYGGSGSDRIAGRGGNDRLFGEDGNDTIIGEEGFDRIDGGDGNDLLDGGLDNDVIFGGAGLDFLLGRSGDDSLFGGIEQDTIVGGDGADFIKGNTPTRDKLVGGNGGVGGTANSGDVFDDAVAGEIDNAFVIDATILDQLLF